MATSSASVDSLIADYSQLNTIPALAGVLFFISSAVQFLGMSISIAQPISYSFPAEHAMLVSLVLLIVAFAASDTRSFAYYEGWEQLIIGVAVAGMVSAEYMSEVQTILNNNPQWGGTAMFVVSVVAWAILSR